MKVLKDNKEGWTLEITCKDCKSELTVEASDVYWELLGCFDEFNTYYRADCGACKGAIDLTNKLPS